MFFFNGKINPPKIWKSRTLRFSPLCWFLTLQPRDGDVVAPGSERGEGDERGKNMAVSLLRRTVGVFRSSRDAAVLTGTRFYSQTEPEPLTVRRQSDGIRCSTQISPPARRCAPRRSRVETVHLWRKQRLEENQLVTIIHTVLHKTLQGRKGNSAYILIQFKACFCNKICNNCVYSPRQSTKVNIQKLRNAGGVI